jgi:hypothetical protein
LRKPVVGLKINLASPLAKQGGFRMSLNLSGLFNDTGENLRGKVIGIYVLLATANIAA